VAALLLLAGVLCAVGAVVLGRRSPTGAGLRPAPEPVPARREQRGVLAFLGAHRWLRRSFGAVAVLLLVGAAVAASYPFLTDRYNESIQKRLRREFVSGKTEEAYRLRRIEVGDSLTRLRIPAIDVDTIVVEGTTEDALRAGAGHYPETPLPCEGGNVAIAGHRVTFGKPFNRLGELHVGQEISLETPIGACTYRIVEGPFEVQPGEVWVADPNAPKPMLTLTTCHPQGSARQRLVVRAERVSVRGEAR